MIASLEVYLHWPNDGDARRVAWPAGQRVPTVGEQVYDHTEGRSGTITTVEWNLQCHGDVYLWAVLLGVE